MEEAHHGGETGSVLGSGLKQTHRRLFWFWGVGLKKRSQPASEVPIGGFSLFFLLLTPEGFIVYSTPHLCGVLGQAQRDY